MSTQSRHKTPAALSLYTCNIYRACPSVFNGRSACMSFMSQNVAITFMGITPVALETDRQTDRQRQRQTDRQTESDRQTQTDRDRDRDGQTKSDRQTQTDRHRHRHREREKRLEEPGQSKHKMEESRSQLKLLVCGRGHFWGVRRHGFPHAI